MATRSPFDTKTLNKTASPFADGYPDSLAEILAVLIAHFESQKSASSSLGEEFEEALLRGYITDTSSLLTTHGGTGIRHLARFCMHIFIIVRML